MRGFRDRSTVEEALEAALDGISPLLSESVDVMAAAGRVLADDVVSAVDVPAFRRSMMDGYAVRAEDTYGATAYNPIPLDIVGISMPGTDPDDHVAQGQCVTIVTGAPMPDGADAVLMVENTSGSGHRTEATAPVPVGRNVGRVGEDVTVGALILNSGRTLLPQDVGLLSAVGHDPIDVVRRPTVRIIVSGDELLPPGASPTGTKIVDSNSPMLAALAQRDGGVPEVVRLPDEEGAMEEALARAGADVIVTAGAASVGSEDRVPILVDKLGSLSIHGITMRPSAPTGIGTVNGVRVVILPGNPVSCLAAYDFFAGPVVRSLGGRSPDWPYLSVRRTLARRIVSQIGRTDYARVVIDEGLVNPVAISGSSVLSSVTKASGFVVIPSALEGYAEGTEVTVHCYHGDCGS
ncbi:MAG: molybdopterin molybdenumtransferase MoeA [Actinobacteria bacterium]|nr:MAG: molybdopterin molybdenumtransferase MoeA [Actinomycetota bacterium]